MNKDVPFETEEHKSSKFLDVTSTVPYDSSNSSQDLVLDEECVNDYPQDQSNDHRDEKDGLEKMPRAFHP